MNDGVMVSKAFALLSYTPTQGLFPIFDYIGILHLNNYFVNLLGVDIVHIENLDRTGTVIISLSIGSPTTRRVFQNCSNSTLRGTPSPFLCHTLQKQREEVLRGVGLG